MVKIKNAKKLRHDIRNDTIIEDQMADIGYFF